MYTLEEVQKLNPEVKKITGMTTNINGTKYIQCYDGFDELKYLNLETKALQRMSEIRNYKDIKVSGHVKEKVDKYKILKGYRTYDEMLLELTG